jgi:hypothetical protein
MVYDLQKEKREKEMKTKQKGTKREKNHAPVSIIDNSIFKH